MGAAWSPGNHARTKPFGKGEQHEGTTMTKAGDKPFDWIAASAFISGAAVMVPSLAALAVALLAVVAVLL
jgi:hypothetical protein